MKTAQGEEGVVIQEATSRDASVCDSIDANPEANKVLVEFDRKGSNWHYIDGLIMLDKTT